MNSPAPLPTAELADLGERLQQAIVLTRVRVTPLSESRVKARAVRVLERADRLFRHMTLMVQASNSLTSFLTKAMGVTVEDMFAYTGRPKIARGVAYAGVSAANDAVRNVLIELAVNAAIDKEVKNGKKSTENRPA
jgi:hypothetical protein